MSIKHQKIISSHLQRQTSFRKGEELFTPFLLLAFSINPISFKFNSISQLHIKRSHEKSERKSERSSNQSDFLPQNCGLIIHMLRRMLRVCYRSFPPDLHSIRASGVRYTAAFRLNLKQWQSGKKERKNNTSVSGVWRDVHDDWFTLQANGF